MVKKIYLTSYEKKVLRLLYYSRASLTQYEIARQTDMSWGSAKKYITRLKNKSILKIEKSKLVKIGKEKQRVNYYKFNYKYYEKLKKKHKI